MLSKLLKYEIKATGRIFLPLFLALLIFAGITKFLSVISPEKMSTPATLSMVIYIIIMVGMFVMTCIMMIQRFYRNLLSEEGYLMLTLPVRPWEHIVTKLLVSMLWIVASGMAALISILIIALQKGDFTRIIAASAAFIQHMHVHLGTSLYLYSLEIILSIFISLASAIMIVYASIAIGHLFSQHKMLASFGAFILLNTISQILFMLFGSGIANLSNINFSSNDFMGMQSVIQQVIAYGIVFTGLLGAAYFAVTNFILSKRLNLE